MAGTATTGAKTNGRRDGGLAGARSLRRLPVTAAAAGGPVRLRTLVYIRWVAIIGQLATLVLVEYGLDFPLPILACYVTVGCSVLVNLVVSLRNPLGTRLSDVQASAYLAFDILQLSVLLYLTGGLHNPFSVLLIAPVTVSATVLSRGSTIGLGLLAGACLSVLALTHEPFPWPAAGFTLPDFYVMGIWQALIVAVIFIAAYVGSVSEEARALTDALAATQLALGREQRASELGALAAAAAHELGSPLATIAVVAKEMERDVDPDSPIAEDVRLLIQESNRCRDILTQLVREPAQDGAGKFNRAPVSAVVEGAAGPLKPDAVGLAFTRTDEDGSGEPEILPSPEIVHALGTLVQNALQFAMSHVQVTTRWSEETVRVVIQDDGPGFPPHLLDRLGEPYVSTRIGEPDGGGHMGLGIFIAQTLLHRTGGQLTFGNRESGGAVVSVEWPRAALTEWDKRNEA
jgi:two-component system sensor histidine kinase RegB